MKRNSEYIMTKIIEQEPLCKPAQIGVDLTIKSVSAIAHQSILNEQGKMELGPYIPIPPHSSSPTGRDAFWDLQPGSYAIEFDQGLKKLEPNENAFIIQRSSLNRAGTQIIGSVYDPGFETDTLGATMNVAASIRIYQHARVAQILIDNNEPVKKESLYKGTWQNKSNR
jgi:deoxycytidine triphosphate deaminase